MNTEIKTLCSMIKFEGEQAFWTVERSFMVKAGDVAGKSGIFNFNGKKYKKSEVLAVWNELEAERVQEEQASVPVEEEIEFVSPKNVSRENLSLVETFKYCGKTGKIFRKTADGSLKKVGTQAKINGKVYVFVPFQGKNIMAHRLVNKMLFGSDGRVKFKDKNASNLKFENLVF